MSSIISVNLPQNPYHIAIAPGSLSQLGAQLEQLNLKNKVLLVSSPEILAFYGETVLSSLTDAGFAVTTHMIPAGETYKTLDTVSRIYDTALAHRMERSSTFIAFGGGVIGDMTGFAAATWLRGVNFVQVPTTLLSMVDASIGGKTGVNHPQGKNLIGAFYQPRLVAIDPVVLKTLPVREFRAGMAEVIKYGIIWDTDLFTQLEAAEKLADFSDLSEALLQTIITRSCQAKADVVSQDEKESGLRAILNYGHTIAHAVESLTGYSAINHGEAVAIGMVAAARIATKLNLWSSEAESRQNNLIRKAGLPTAIPTSIDAKAIVDALKIDKKVESGIVRFILPTQIGKVIITDRVSSDLVLEVVEEVKA